MTNKIFAERLNQELSEIGMPERLDERVASFAKAFHMPKYKSEAILNGNLQPDSELLTKLAEELEVSTAWLLGKDRERH